MARTIKGIKAGAGLVYRRDAAGWRKPLLARPPLSASEREACPGVRHGRVSSESAGVGSSLLRAARLHLGPSGPPAPGANRIGLSRVTDSSGPAPLRRDCAVTPGARPRRQAGNRAILAPSPVISGGITGDVGWCPSNVTVQSPGQLPYVQVRVPRGCFCYESEFH